MLRYLVSSAVAGMPTIVSHDGSARFPLGTLAVNVTGCLMIGALGAIGHQVQPWSSGARLILFTGILGGFTTFSAFGYETFELARGGATGLAALNVLAQLVAGLGAVWVGYRLVLLSMAINR